MSDRPADLALLRRHEPVLHFTRGEMFLPTRIDGYLQRCSLWRSPNCVTRPTKSNLVQSQRRSRRQMDNFLFLERLRSFGT